MRIIPLRFSSILLVLFILISLMCLFFLWTRFVGVKTDQMNLEPVWVGDIESTTLKNDSFRQVLRTGPHSQLVVMSLQPGQDIGWERHTTVDQFLRLEQGRGMLVYGQDKDAEQARRVPIQDKSGIWIPAGTWHNVENSGSDRMKLYTVYAPAEHPPYTHQLLKPTTVNKH